MRFSEAKGHKVVSTATAETVGKLDRMIVDAPTQSVLALKLKKTSDGDTLLWSDLVAFGADAVTVADAAKIGEPTGTVAALSDKDHQLLGKRVLTTGGDDIGKVEDFEFDPDTGAITSLTAAAAVLEGVRLVGLGSYAVVVDPVGTQA